MYCAAFITYSLSNTKISFDEYLKRLGLKEVEKITVDKEEIEEIHKRAEEILKKMEEVEKNEKSI